MEEEEEEESLFSLPGRLCEHCVLDQIFYFLPKWRDRHENDRWKAQRSTEIASDFLSPGEIARLITENAGFCGGRWHRWRENPFYCGVHFRLLIPVRTDYYYTSYRTLDQLEVTSVLLDALEELLKDPMRNATITVPVKIYNVELSYWLSYIMSHICRRYTIESIHDERFDYMMNVNLSESCARTKTDQD